MKEGEKANKSYVIMLSIDTGCVMAQIKVAEAEFKLKETHHRA